MRTQHKQTTIKILKFPPIQKRNNNHNSNIPNWRAATRSDATLMRRFAISTTKQQQPHSANAPETLTQSCRNSAGIQRRPLQMRRSVVVGQSPARAYCALRAPIAAIHAKCASASKQRCVAATLIILYPAAIDTAFYSFPPAATSEASVRVDRSLHLIFNRILKT